MLQEERVFDSISARAKKPTLDNNICERKGISGLIPNLAAKVTRNKIYFGKKSFPQSFKIGDFSEKNFPAEAYSDTRRITRTMRCTEYLPASRLVLGRYAPGTSRATGRHR